MPRKYSPGLERLTQSGDFLQKQQLQPLMQSSQTLQTDPQLERVDRQEPFQPDFPEKLRFLFQTQGLTKIEG